MIDEAASSLAFIARQLKKPIGDVSSMRDDLTVLTAMTMRLDGSHTALLTELRAMPGQQGRMNNRLRELEKASGEGAS